MEKREQEYLEGYFFHHINKDEQASATAKLIQSFKEEGGATPFSYVIQRFRLDAFEQHILKMTLASCVCPTVYAFLQQEGLNGITVGLLLNSFEETENELRRRESKLAAFSAASFKFVFRLELEQNFLYSRIYLCQRIFEFLVLEQWQGEIIAGAANIEPEQEKKPFIGDVPQYFQELNAFSTKYTENNHYLLKIHGRHGSGRVFGLINSLKESNKGLLLLEAESIVAQQIPPLSVVRETILLDQILVLRNVDAIQGQEREVLEDWIITVGSYLNLVVVTCENTSWHIQNAKVGVCIAHQCDLPDYDKRKSLWESYFSYYGYSCPWVEELAKRYQFTPAQIENTVKEILWGENQTKAQLEYSLVLSIANRQIAHELCKYATIVKPIFQWEDLILEEFQKNKIEEACAQIEWSHQVYGAWGFGDLFHYGRGVTLLFTGSPGTGKTMAAQVVAKKLCMELYKVDLATIVSKYVGETEKNLKVIFEEAGKIPCVLFFDEGDVLFSKRTEVKGANDKYNNLEAAFLLQKLEDYKGLVIIATNYMQNIDEAFKRRMRYIVEFSVPGPKERLKLWYGNLPHNMPVDEELDFHFLANAFELTGSNIKNILLNAAFLVAMQGDKKLEMKHIIGSIKNEVTKYGKTIEKEEFGEYSIYLS